MESLQPTIDKGITSYANGNKKLRTRANILATEALDKYDPKAGSSLNTWIFSNLRGLARFNAQRGTAVHIPENVRLDRGQVKRFVADYEAREGFEPSQQTIADSLEMSQKRVQKAMGRTEVSESQALSDKGDLRATKSPQDMWADYVYHDLDEINQKVFEWTTGYGGVKRLSKKDIARKLNITPAAVSIRVTKIMGKLAEGTV
jgi:DNA-directed RNA polymerase specialized sigma subunit